LDVLDDLSKVEVLEVAVKACLDELDDEDLDFFFLLKWNEGRGERGIMGEMDGESNDKEREEGMSSLAQLEIAKRDVRVDSTYFFDFESFPFSFNPPGLKSYGDDIAA
jgi:hypothetical protein